MGLERLEPEDLRARYERAVDIKIGIESGRPDQPQRSRLDVGQKNVLLRFVEVMNFIHKQDCCFPGSAQPIGRRAITRRISATLLSTPLMRMKRAWVICAMMRARVVLPLPGGP